MVRRISTKWVLAVLAVVVLPFLGFAWYVDAFVSQRFSDDVVRYHLLGHAAELAERLDRVVEEHQRDVRVLAKVQDLSLSLADREGDAVLFEDAVVKLFDAQVREAGAGAFVFAVDAEGELVVGNRLGGDGTALDPWTLGELERRDWRSEPWFREAMETGSASLDVFRSDLVHESADVPLEARYHFGFAERVDGRRRAGRRRSRSASSSTSSPGRSCSPRSRGTASSGAVIA